MLLDGTLLEIPDAECAALEIGQLICRYAKRHLVKSSPSTTVDVYGNSEAFQVYRESLPH